MGIQSVSMNETEHTTREVEDKEVSCINPDDLYNDLVTIGFHAALAAKAEEDIRSTLVCAEWHEETCHYLNLMLDEMMHLFIAGEDEQVTINQEALMEIEHIGETLAFRKMLAGMAIHTQLPLFIAFLSKLGISEFSTYPGLTPTISEGQIS